MTDSVKGVCAPSSDPEQMFVSRLVENEGVKRFAYKDSLGYVSVGIGRCLDQKKGKGLSIDECFYLLNNDLKECRSLLAGFNWYSKQDRTRQDVLVELCFNLGLKGLAAFKRMIAALEVNNYQVAVNELKDSLWATQVGKSRVDDITYRLLTGRYK